jgi:hypothetical protein
MSYSSRPLIPGSEVRPNFSAVIIPLPAQSRNPCMEVIQPMPH